MVFRPRKEITIPPHYTPDHPESEVKQVDLEKYNEQLHQDTRPIAVKPRLPVLEPSLNRLYGSGRSEGDWRYFIDNYAVGTLTTIANTVVTTAILLANPPNMRLLQWPQAVQAFLVIRKFSMAPQSAITTVGAVDVQFNDLAGNIIPMGDFVSSGNLAYDVDSIIPTAIVDPGVGTVGAGVGNLLVKLAGTTPTVSVYNYQIAFSYAYLLPSLEGYEVESIHRVLGRRKGEQ